MLVLFIHGAGTGAYEEDRLLAMGMPPQFLPTTPTLNDEAEADRSVTVRDYRRTKRPACETDVTAGGEPRCLPQWKFPLKYGWYCGAGRPIEGFKGNPRLDPVDYCCRLHDQNLFGLGGVSARHNACGFMMCLSQATGSPEDITERLPDTENARRQMYHQAALLCQQLVPVPLPEPTIVP